MPQSFINESEKRQEKRAEPGARARHIFLNACEGSEEEKKNRE